MTSPHSGAPVTYLPGWSGVSYIDALLPIFKWGSGGVGTGATITYSFPVVGSTWSSLYNSGEQEPDGLQPLSEGYKSKFRAALATWSEVANIQFVEVSETSSNVGDIRVAGSAAVTQSNSVAWAYVPWSATSSAGTTLGDALSGDIWLDLPYLSGPGTGGFDVMTLVHEIGHALGLEHSFKDGTNDPNFLTGAEDTTQYTVMSYSDYENVSIYPSAPMLYDIAVIQYVYGANMSTRAGNDSYTFSTLPGGEFRCIWDAGGTDVFDCSSQNVAATINLNAGSFSSIGIRSDGVPAIGNISIAFGATIENATGTAYGDVITGNSVANVLQGGAGNDTLIGNAGDDDIFGEDGNDSLNGGDGVDQLYGHAGKDVLIGGSAADWLEGGLDSDIYKADETDTVSEAANGGFDTVEMTASSGGLTFDLTGAYQNIEHLTLLGAFAADILGNDGANILTGNAAINNLSGGLSNDALFGGGGNDVLNGGSGNDVLDGGAGADTLRGGAGNDTYVIDSLLDVIEQETSGTDHVKSAITYVLSAELENLTLLGTAALNGTGNASANTLTGNDGINILDGGSGADTLNGGKGNDVYLVDSASDVVVESLSLAQGGGTDRIKTSLSWSLASLANVERLTLTGTDHTYGIGNALDNILYGNSGDNILTGGAGNDILLGDDGHDVLAGNAGVNTLEGGLGDDRYKVNEKDTIKEAAGEGSDWVQMTAGVAGLTFTLAGMYQNIERFELLGTLAGNLTGNDFDNILIGNSGANRLNGGVGADTLIGGAGNDTYVVDNAFDNVVENSNGGVDTVEVATTASLVALGNIENLTLTGTAHINGTGNALANVITGNAGNNVLDGSGGADTLIGGGGNDRLIGSAGADALIGGAGNDTYVVDNVGEVVEEQNGGNDTVEIASTINLLALDNIENLTLTGTGDFNATGDGVANILIGNSGNNVLDGSGGDDTLLGHDGEDVLTGGSGGDVLSGGSGNDELSGGSGGDTLIGGLGIDEISSGSGQDVFEFLSILEGGDTITDFTKSAGNDFDVLKLDDLLDGLGYAGTDPFADGYLAFQQVGANTVVGVDANGGGDNYVTLVTLNNVALTAADTSNYIID